MISTDFSRQDIKNNNFYEEGQIKNVEHEGFDDPFFEPNSIDYTENQISNHKGLSHYNDDSKMLTPTKVIESLDLVLDSFLVDSVSPDVMSVENVSSVSNVALVELNHQTNYDYRDTQNTVLHAKLLQALDISDQSYNLENANVRPIKISDQVHSTETSFELDSAYEESYKQGDHPTNVESINVEKFDSEDLHLDDRSTHLETLLTVDHNQKENSFNSSSELNECSSENLKSQEENEADTNCLSTKISVIHENIQEPKTGSSVTRDSVSPAVFNNSDELSESINEGISDTTFTPPIPPPMANYNSYSKQKRKRSSSEQEVSVKSDKLKLEGENRMKLFDENSLKLVKLRHVSRPSLDHRFINTEHTLETSHSLPHTPIVSRHMNNTSENEMHINTPQRMEISKDAIKSLKLKPLKILPSSLRKKDEDQKPDSVQFGSLEFEQFRSELNEKLKNPVSRAPSFLVPKSAHKKINTAVKNDDVIEDNIDMEKARTIIQLEIESKLNILSNSSEDVISNITAEDTSKILPNEGNAQIVGVSNIDQTPSVEIKD